MKRRKLISVLVLILLLFNLSIGVFAGEDDGTCRPEIMSYSAYEGELEYPIVSLGSDDGTCRPD